MIPELFKKIFYFYVIINIMQLNLLVNCINHCKQHRYKNSFSTGHMQFTKEIISNEYAVINQLKGLHCCAKGYRSIEWFKDGKPYPWFKDVSSFILYPEAANQTIYTRHIKNTDSGEYSCILRNDTGMIEHFIQLSVQDNNIPDTPLSTFTPENQIINVGDSTRFYCEAFVGQVDLPDMKSNVYWYQVFDDEIEPVVNAKQEKIERENGQIIGSYLIIPETKLHHYGRYLCRIEIGNQDHRLEMTAWLFKTAEDSNTILIPLILALVAATCTLILIYVLRCRLFRMFFVENRRGDDECCRGSGGGDINGSSRGINIDGVENGSHRSDRNSNTHNAVQAK